MKSAGGRTNATQPSPLEVMLASLNSGDMNVQVKRKMKDGSLADAQPSQLEGLNTKARIATAAQGLKHLPPEERTAWAIEMKDYANELYANNLIQDAMEKYVEALAASDFGKGNTAEESSNGTSSSQDNIDVLILPILCNLSACCIQIKDFAKGLKFADQALELRPNCGKALMRRGMCLLQHGEFTRAIECLEASTKITIESAKEQEGKEAVDKKLKHLMPVSDSDIKRIPILLDKANKSLEAENRCLAKRKQNLMKHFGGPAAPAPSPSSSAASPPFASSSSSSSSSASSTTEIAETKRGALATLIVYLLSLWASILAQFTGKTEKKRS